MKKPLILCFFFLFIIVSAFSQKSGQERIDSLLDRLTYANGDTNKVRLLYYISGTYYSIDPDKGISYGEQGLDLARKLNWKKGIADLNTAIGVSYWVKSDYPKALEYYFNALKENEELGDKKGIAANSNNIALIYQNQSDPKKAVEYYFKALKIFEELEDKNRIAQCLCNIGTIYEDMADFPKALEFYKKSLEMNKALESKKDIALNLCNIGIVYRKVAEYPKAIEFLFMSLNAYEEIGDKSGIGTNLDNIGYAYLLIAKDSSRKQLNLLFDGNKTAALKKAKTYCVNAIEIFKEIDYLNDLKDAYRNLSEIQELLGDYNGALESYKNYTACKDSVFNESNNNKITLLESKREQELNQKQLEIKDLQIKKEKIEKRFILGGVFLLLCLTLLTYNRYRLKNKANILIQKEKQRSDNLLLNILPAEVAEELKETGTAKAKNFDSVTVLFTDFKDFTNIGERMSPVELVGEINECFSAFDNIISKYGIEKIKTIGDSYMCAGGIPLVNTTHPEDVVKAAIEMRDFMNRHKAEKLASNGFPFEIRIGINTGPVVAGIVGVKKFAYDIWGDSVNKASRMESSSEAGKINISGSTYELVKDKFNCVYRGKILAKNKGEVDMYFVEDAITPSHS